MLQWMHIRWAPPKWALWRKGWQKHCETTFSPHLGRFFLVSKRTFDFFWEGGGRTRHPGPGPRDVTPGQLSIEFMNVGGWLTSGDLAMDSCAQFPAVAGHRLIPSRARSVRHHLRKAGHQSIWAPACQHKIAGGHAGVGVISLGGAPLSLPSFCHPSVSGVLLVRQSIENHSSYFSRRSGSSFCCLWLSGG